jgi:nicotinamidase-related amidase
MYRRCLRSGDVPGRWGDAVGRAQRFALLMVDFVNPLRFAGADRLAPMALAAGAATARLKARCRRANWPTIYANDNFGQWNSEFSSLVKRCATGGSDSAALVDLLTPDKVDLSILKPRHSAFYGSPLEFLLVELRVSGLIITGIAADSCVLFTAMDAFLRRYSVWVPRDCVASESLAKRDAALTQMRDAAKVWTGPSRTPLRTARARCFAAQA